MILLITGSRNHRDVELIESSIEAVARQHGAELLVHGQATGADTIAGKYAKKIGLPVIEVPALWDSEGKAAGPIRNSRMLGYATALASASNTLVRLLAFPLEGSKGTYHMIKLCDAAHIPGDTFERLT